MSFNEVRINCIKLMFMANNDCLWSSRFKRRIEGIHFLTSPVYFSQMKLSIYSFYGKTHTINQSNNKRSKKAKSD